MGFAPAKATWVIALTQEAPRTLPWIAVPDETQLPVVLLLGRQLSDPSRVEFTTAVVAKRSPVSAIRHLSPAPRSGTAETSLRKSAATAQAIPSWRSHPGRQARERQREREGRPALARDDGWFCACPRRMD